VLAVEDHKEFLIETEWLMMHAHCLRMKKSVWRTLFLICLTAVLLVISLPWSKFDGTPHWENVYWIPFTGPLSLHPKVIFEIVGNFILFVPIGYLFVRGYFPDIKRPLLWATAVGSISSLSMEAYELLCRYRAIETADLILNTAGTVLGAQIALKLDDSIIKFLFRCTPSPPNSSAESE
jgi:glycopeptide antibiotics resistance protein